MLKQNTLNNKNTISNTLNQAKENYSSIDLFKFICAVLIVYIHTTPLSSFSMELDYYIKNIFTRVAVPFFFASSGFFFFKKITFENGKIKKCKENTKLFFTQIKRYMLIYLIWAIVYFIWLFFTTALTPDMELREILIFGYNCFIDLFAHPYFHLWYMLAMIYAFIILFVVLRYISIKAFIPIAILLFIIKIYFYAYLWLPISIPQNIIELVNNDYIFNRVFGLAIPYIFIGIVKNHMDIKIAKKINLIGFIIFFCLNAIEFILLYNFTNADTAYEQLFMLLPCVYFFFNVVTDIKLKENTKVYLMLRKLSSLIYFIHPIIQRSIWLMFLPDEPHSLLEFFIVMAISILLSYIIITLTKNKIFKFLKYIY